MTEILSLTRCRRRFRWRLVPVLLAVVAAVVTVDLWLLLWR